MGCYFYRHTDKSMKTLVLFFVLFLLISENRGWDDLVMLEIGSVIETNSRHERTAWCLEIIKGWKLLSAREGCNETVLWKINKNFRNCFQKFCCKIDCAAAGFVNTEVVCQQAAKGNWSCFCDDQWLINLLCKIKIWCLFLLSRMELLLALLCNVCK